MRTLPRAPPDPRYPQPPVPGPARAALSGGSSGAGGCSAPPPRWTRWGWGGGSRLRFAPRLRPLRLRLPPGGVLRTRLDCAETPGRAVAALCALLGLPHPEELSLLWPERVGEGRDPPPAPPRPGPDPPETSWLDVGRSLLEQGVAAEQELELRFKYPCAMGEPQPGLHSQLLQAQALGSILAEEIECSEEQGLRFAALQYLIEGPEWGEGRDPQDPPEPPPDLEAALEKLELSLGGGATPETPGQGEEPGAPPELDEELEIHRGSPWPFRGSRPARATLSGSSLSLWSPPGSGGPQQQLNLRGCEVIPQVDLGAQKFHVKLGVPSPGGPSETLLRCRDAPQFSRWLCGLQAASGWGSPSSGGGVPII
ncbi:fermitin family homolog 3-like [Agelaius tricolor]|uniref:fermitin family homolog 3-like n=1 Tax=Agelaius tricolor TaxID=9191 RepID=UPI0039F1C01E